jgi:hypothetical protein
MMSIIKRMLSGAVAGTMFLLGGVAEAGTVRTHVDIVDAAGAVQSMADLQSLDGRPVCVVIQPSDNAAPAVRRDHRACVLVRIARYHLGQGVVIQPSDNVVIQPSDNVVIQPSDNVVIQPSDNVVIRPTDNRCDRDVIILPSDNRSDLPRCARQALLTTGDDLESEAAWVVVRQNGRTTAVYPLGE